MTSLKVTVQIEMLVGKIVTVKIYNMLDCANGGRGSLLVSDKAARAFSKLQQHPGGAVRWMLTVAASDFHRPRK